MSSSPTEERLRSRLDRQVTMPQMGISVAEGTILEWRKRPGDWVEADETVCDVTTDKVDVEIPSPASGPPRADPGRAGRDRRGRHGARRDRRRQRQPGEAHPDERNGGRAATAAAHLPRGRSRRRRTSIARGSTRPWSGGSRTSTASTSTRSRAPGSADGSGRRTSWRSSTEAAARPGAAEPAAHMESPYQQAGAERPGYGGARARRWRSCSGRRGASRCPRCDGPSPAT